MTRSQHTADADQALEHRARAVPMTTAARQLGVHRSTLWRMLRDEQIRTVKIRGRRLVPVAEIERIVAGEPLDLRPKPQPATPDPVGEPVGTPAAARVEKRRLFPMVSR